MRRTANQARTAVKVLLGAYALLSGCSLGSLWGRDEGSAGVETGTANGALDGEGLVEYLEIMRRLVEGDPVTQAETFLEVATAASESPTTTNRLKLALAIATPGHPGSDAAEAQRRLSALLAAGAALLPEERMLVAIHLKEVEQRLILDSEAERLRAEVDAARARQDNEVARRLQAALEENERLTKALEEAQQKLDAITSIERSIRERENGANP